MGRSESVTSSHQTVSAPRKLVLPSILAQVFHPSWCEACVVIQHQIWMNECDILWDQNILWPLVHIFRGSGPILPPVIYTLHLLPVCLLLISGYSSVRNTIYLVVLAVTRKCTLWRCKSTPTPKGKLLWMTSHYGPTVVRSVTEIPFHVFIW